jgi:hypothetical protein
MRKPVRDIGAPVRVCRLNLAKERHQPFDLLLTRFAHQRFLYRLSISRHRQRFVLKGAMLMTAWLDDPIVRRVIWIFLASVIPTPVLAGGRDHRAHS